jgi:hypothetical protein
MPPARANSFCGDNLAAPARIPQGARRRWVVCSTAAGCGKLAGYRGKQGLFRLFMEVASVAPQFVL